MYVSACGTLLTTAKYSIVKRNFLAEFAVRVRKIFLWLNWTKVLHQPHRHFTLVTDTWVLGEGLVTRLLIHRKAQNSSKENFVQ